MEFKVINIINHAPAYDIHRDRPRPAINWDTPNGKWVGIWGFEWHDILGNNVLRMTNDLTYEVWQPDDRADKIYEHIFPNGLVHKLFPAIYKSYVFGFKLHRDITSDILVEELEKEVNRKQPLVLHVNAGYRYINVPILNKLYNRVPIVSQFYTNSLETFEVPKTINPFRLAHAYKKNHLLRNYYRKVKYIIPSVSEGVEYFEKKFGAKIYYRDVQNFGSDYKEWSRKFTITEARKKLGIPDDKFIFFSSSRLIPVKQIDRMIVALSKLKNKNFICYISGRGKEEYEIYLKKLVSNSKMDEYIKFIGYVDVEILQTYFQAADLLLSTSKLDAGPSSPFHASAMGTPSLITDTGIASEFFKKHSVGIIVPVDNYERWVMELEEVLKGKNIKVPPREKVVEFGDWDKISKYYYEIYKNLLNYAI
ncbi:MAG: glycosyltransferase family 4 protein [Bacteroidales bacterium]